MTFKPTKARQRAWVKKHLNDGVCPKESRMYKESWFNLPRTRALEHSPACVHTRVCWDALNWLSESDVTSLEEAWDQCPHPAWLLWALCWMKPDSGDVKKSLILLKLIADSSALVDTANEARSILGKVDQLSPTKFLCLVHDIVHFRVAFHSEFELLDKVLVEIRRLWDNPWRLK